MKTKQCSACSRQWFGSHTYCPDCGSPWMKPRHTILNNIVWIAVAMVLILWLTRSR